MFTIYQRRIEISLIVAKTLCSKSKLYRAFDLTEFQLTLSTIRTLYNSFSFCRNCFVGNFDCSLVVF